ncbi:MAG: penicillin-binding transpeptidase domain-containing protein, partial [bacterium]
RRRFILKHQSEISEKIYGSRRIVTLSQILSDSLLTDSLFSSRAVVQVALVALDPRSGDILALIGGRDFKRSQFNRAVQAIRQPGSVFKPFVFTAAVDNGYPPSFEVLNQEVVIAMHDGSRWVPQNYDGSVGGLTTLREALRRSLNLCTVRLTQEVVPPQLVVDYARRMGISTRLDPVESIGLGPCGVIPLDATAAFAIFAAGGIYHRPRAVIRVEDPTGKALAEYPTESRVVLTPQTAYIMTDLLADALNRGTGASARSLYNFTAPAAGKTGTTNEFTDAWFIGYTPHLICGVWVGLDDPRESLGPRQSGAVVALPIWAKFMKQAYDRLELPPEPFPMPSGVVELTICKDTKLIANPWCPVTDKEIFRSDLRPVKQCSKHSSPPGKKPSL